MILFAALTFALFAVAAVVIDVGLASLTQAQMQSATDSAALEGCRLRNFDEGLGYSHTQKRIRAGAMVRLAFDDDLNPTQGGYVPDNYDLGTAPSAEDDPDSAQISAGPALRVSGGSGAWATNSILGEQPASEFARIDDPRLELNLSNSANGDMVTGNWRSDPVDSGPQFLPAPSATENRNALSFLVRMRRAGDSNPDDTQADVSSSLPTLPVVFGLASTILQDPSNDWDPRRDGITVRATSIAGARPAMRVGRTPCDGMGNPIVDHEPGVPLAQRNPIAGLVPFFIYRDQWVSFFRETVWGSTFIPMPPGAPQHPGRVRVESDGRIVVANEPTRTVGHFMFGAGPVDPCGAELGWPEVVGRSVPLVTSTPVRGFRFTRTKPAYIAIVQDIPDPATGVLVPRVVGYGFAHVWPLGGPAGETTPPYAGTGDFVISPGELINHGPVNCWIAQDNASAILKSSSNESVGVALDIDTLEEVLSWSNDLAYGTATPDPNRIYDYTYIQRGTVLAPALTR